MKPLKVESSHYVEFYHPKTRRWFICGPTRLNLKDARERRETYRKMFKRVRIIKHELSTTVVL